MTRFVGMIANQRSGTHMIRWAVNDLGYAVCPPEPFFKAWLVRSGQMKEWLRQWESGPGPVLVDVKYNQITAPVQAFLEREDVRVLHLIRRDTKRMFYSQELRRWLEGLPDKGESIKVPENAPALPFDRARYNDYVEYVNEQRERWTYLETTRLYYEDVTGNQSIEYLPDWAGRIVCALLGVQYKPMHLKFTKQAPSDEKRLWL